MESHEYWDEIESLAQQVTKEAREYKRDVHEVLHEMIDGHGWVIYCRFPPFVLAYSPNDSAMWEEGLEGGITSHDEYMTRAAYCAMIADVREHEDFDADLDEEEGE